MFLQLSHKDLLVAKETRRLVNEVYKLLDFLPVEEKYAMGSQLRRAVLSVYLNLNEGCGKESAKERKRFFETSRASLIEVDAIIEVALDLGFLKENQLCNLPELLLSSFRLLSNLIRSIQ